MNKKRKLDGAFYRDVLTCGLGRQCVWPSCTCPADVQRVPIPPPVKRRTRPKGWSPLSDWVVVRTKTGSENYACGECRNQDMETWLPRYMEPGRGVPTALFPGYIFVRPNGQWRKLRNTYGVIDIVMMGDRPDYVPKVVLNALKKNADKNGIVTLANQRPPKKGERVKIQIGAWKGFEGLYDGLDGEGRNQVLFSMFGKTVTLKFRRAASIEVMDG